MVHRVATSDTTSDNKLQQVVQRMTTSENEWCNEWQRTTTSDNEWKWMTKSDIDWQRVIQRGLWIKTSDNKWESARVT